MIGQGHDNKPVRSAGSCVGLDQTPGLDPYDMDSIASPLVTQAIIIMIKFAAKKTLTNYEVVAIFFM